MATDPTVYPDSVFRMQFCYVHDANGGNNVKSRAARNEIYYNWIEGALYHEVECIGSDGAPEDAVREDSDIVGNVLVKRSDFAVTRFGGDGTGQTNGRYRFVNNTVVVAGDDAVFRLFDGIESLEAHNNVFASAAMSTVNLVREVEASWVRLSVEDHGTGLQPDQLERIFEKFYRADHSETAPSGTGLGLYIAQTIVEAHGGSIDASSIPGQGTRISFTLPTQGLPTASPPCLIR
jgi:hypothetical protein